MAASKARLKAKNIMGVEEGGTGATSMGAGSVGIVSQTTGVPTGKVIESGSNSQGRYVKFADGTLICTRTIVTNSTGAYAVGTALFGSDAYSGGAFPATYVATPFVTASSMRGQSSPCAFPSCYTEWSTTSWGSWRTIATDNSAVASVIYLTAVGRWF